MTEEHQNEVVRKVRHLMSVISANNARVARKEMAPITARHSSARAMDNFKRFLKELP